MKLFFVLIFLFSVPSYSRKPPKFTPQKKPPCLMMNYKKALRLREEGRVKLEAATKELETASQALKRAEEASHKTVQRWQEKIDMKGLVLSAYKSDKRLIESFKKAQADKLRKIVEELLEAIAYKNVLEMLKGIGEEKFTAYIEMNRLAAESAEIRAAVTKAELQGEKNPEAYQKVKEAHNKHIEAYAKFQKLGWEYDKVVERYSSQYKLPIYGYNNASLRRFLEIYNKASERVKKLNTEAEILLKKQGEIDQHIREYLVNVEQYAKDLDQITREGKTAQIQKAHVAGEVEKARERKIQWAALVEKAERDIHRICKPPAFSREAMFMKEDAKPEPEPKPKARNPRSQ